MKEVTENIYMMTPEEREAKGIEDLPSNLHNALKSLRADEVVRESMGEHLYKNFFEAKTREYYGYRQHVSDWERDKYMLQY